MDMGVGRPKTTEDKEPEYRRLVKTIVLPYFNQCDGYRGCKFARSTSTHDDQIEILVMTLWRDMKAVEAFSGDPGAHAYLPDDIARTLESYDSTSEHFEVFIEE
jgi:heme-degrading monooxygenase HmoA